MKLCKRIFSLWSVLIVLLFAAVLIVPASAADISIFSIPGKSVTVDVPDTAGVELRSSFSSDNKDYGPLNIPHVLLAQSPVEKSSIFEKKYNLVYFNNPIPVKSDLVELPITLYGKSYIADLEKIPIDLHEDMTGYIGTIRDLDDAKITVVVTNTNIFHASVYIDGETIEIIPAQNSQYLAETTMPLHVVYSTSDIPYEGGTTGDYVEELPEILATLYTNMSSPQKSQKYTTTINVLFVTDNNLALSSSWITSAGKLITDSYSAFADNRINIILNPIGYDASRASILSISYINTISKTPLETAKLVFPTNYLDGKNADVLVYLGGYDQYNPTAIPIDNRDYIGHGGFPHTSNARYAWVQMVPNNNPEVTPYQATDSQKVRIFTHEMGHVLGAEHTGDATYFENGQTWRYVMAFPFTGIYEIGLKFTQQNCNAINSNKIAVSNYV